MQPFQLQFQFDSNYMMVRREVTTLPSVDMTSFSSIEDTVRPVISILVEWFHILYFIFSVTSSFVSMEHNACYYPKSQRSLHVCIVMNRIELCWSMFIVLLNWRDWTNDLLRVGGYYLFSSWCKLQCQQSHMRSLTNIHGSLNPISPLVLRMGSQRYQLTLRHIDVFNGAKGTTI